MLQLKGSHGYLWELTVQLYAAAKVVQARRDSDLLQS